MRFFLVLFSILSTQLTANSYWPKSETMSYEVIDGSKFGFQIPLPDFNLVKQTVCENGISVMSKYQSAIELQKEFLFFCDSFDEIIDLETYSNWVTYGWVNNPALQLNLVEHEVFQSGIDGSLLLLKQSWQDSEGFINNLVFFVRGAYGFCFMSRTDLNGKSKWDSFIQTICPCIKLCG